MRARSITPVALLIGCFAFAPFARAEKKLNVKLTHPASLGHLLAGKRVVIGPGSGECSQEFSQMLAVALAAHGTFVVPGEELDALLAKSRIQIGSPVDPGSAMRLGKLLGPSAMLTVEVSRCDVRAKPPTVSQSIPAVYTSRMEGGFQAQVRIIDLADGAELGSRPVHAEASKENQAEVTAPPYPGKNEAKADTLAKALAESQHLFLPWIEVREVPFVDDKECNLKQEFELMKSGDYDGALKLARDSATSCAAAPKVVAGAWYNLGVVLTAQRFYSEALYAFEQAHTPTGKGPAAALIAGCRNDGAIADAAGPLALPEKDQIQVQSAAVMTNAFVMKLVESNVAEDDIVRMVTDQPASFDLGADDLAKLRAAGTPPAVLSAMLNKR